MARYEHLRLVRLPGRLERRKPSFGGAAPKRERQEHSTRLQAELDAAIAAQQQRRRPKFITPSLILRVQMEKVLLEEHWEKLGLTVLSSDPDRTLVLFSSSDEMRELRERFEAYAGEIREGQKNAPYSGFVPFIESIGTVEPRDRIGLRLREAGFTEPEDFSDTEAAVLDVEIWDFGERLLRERKLRQIQALVEAEGAEVLDEYLGPSLTMLRIRATGGVIRTVLTIEEVASVDRPPEPDLATQQAIDSDLASLPLPAAVDEEAPVIGVIDSGINAHPLLEALLIGSIGVPQYLGEADDWGHGTRVASIAAFGNLRDQLAAGKLAPFARLCSAKVVNEQGGFDDKKLVPAQMREAITTLHERFGCRVFVVALGDRTSVYKSGRVGAWAATLDELASELDVVIVVSAGNRQPRKGERLEEAVTEYPGYLLENENRLLEPAGALNVLTVGSLAHGEGLDVELGDSVRVRPITRAHEPSPFTRTGPGASGAVKPDLVDLGGTLVFDPVTRSLKGGEALGSAGVLSLHYRPTERLFASGSGTSYAAPLVALKASQILRRLPTASANLVRALLVGASHLPDAALERLESQGEERTRAVCGYGAVDLERAAYSDDSRVVLYAEDELPLDHFAVYEIPIPELFQAGRRTIRVTLAFDPPVRHTRADYAGVTMSFRLKRGCTPELVFDHYRKRAREEGKHPEIKSRYDCDLNPGPQVREKGTVQTASAAFQRNTSEYGDRYYLVVRCEAGWAANRVLRQRFAVVVELAHETELRLYERIRLRQRASGV
ncbi:MAG: S8 family peptidase [Myxococcota bacterium]|nr:S8 family peptidase [Myxococcota bacterium]